MASEWRALCATWACTAVSLLAGCAAPVAGAAPDAVQQHAASGAAIGAGRLVIVGGALERDNAEVYRAFIEALADAPNDSVAVIGAASAGPSGAARRFGEAMVSHGFAPEKLIFVRLAVRDDDETPDVDEAEWTGNAGNPVEIAKIEASGGVWFTGGDQSRLTDLLFDEDGAATPMLRAIRERLAAGAVVGGTSAGAAAMSRTMITGGDTLATLLQIDSPLLRAGDSDGVVEVTVSNGPTGETLGMGPGLGFFSVGIVDQHFDARARLGRLAAALGALPPAERLGFGVDEDTAMIVDLERQSITVAGTGGVTVVDGRHGGWSETSGRMTIDDVIVSVVSVGDVVDLAKLVVTPAAFLNPTLKNEYYDSPVTSAGGIAVPPSGLADLLGEALLDNSATATFERLAFDAASGRGVLYRFSQQRDGAKGFWGRDERGNARYTITGVELDILPVTVDVTQLAP